MTNRERIRNMTDEELAEFIIKNCDNPLYEVNEDICDRCPVYNSYDEKCNDESCKNMIVAYLKEGAE